MVAPSTTDNQVTERNSRCLCGQTVYPYFWLAHITSHCQLCSPIFLAVLWNLLETETVTVFFETRISCNLSDWMVNYGSTVVLTGMTSALKGKEVIGFPNSKLHLTSVSCQISLTLTPWVPGRLTVHAFIFGKALKLWQALITKVARENVFNKCMLTFLKVQISSSEGYYPKL